MAGEGMAKLTMGDPRVADEAGWNGSDDKPFRQYPDGPAAYRFGDILVAIAVGFRDRHEQIAGLAGGHVRDARRGLNIGSTQEFGLGKQASQTNGFRAFK
jgi:hypothetical protein